MKKIDGVKYISEKEFDEAISKSLTGLYDVSAKAKEKTGSSGLVSSLITAVLTMEFAKLGTDLFDREEEK